MARRSKIVIALINFTQHSCDLSLRIEGAWRRCMVLPAHVTAGGWASPRLAIVTDAHLEALDALDPSDARRIALAGFDRLDLGDVDPSSGRYDAATLSALAAATAPRKVPVYAVANGGSVKVQS